MHTAVLKKRNLQIDAEELLERTDNPVNRRHINSEEREKDLVPFLPKREVARVVVFAHAEPVFHKTHTTVIPVITSQPNFTLTGESRLGFLRQRRPLSAENTQMREFLFGGGGGMVSDLSSGTAHTYLCQDWEKL